MNAKSHCSVIYKKRQNNKYPAVKELTNKLLHNNDEKDEMGLDALTRQMRHSRWKKQTRRQHTQQTLSNAT